MTTLRFPILRPFERGRYGFDNPRSPGGHLWAETTRFRQSYRMSGLGRFLPVATLLSDRQLIGGSSHWDASSRSHIYDIRERQQRVVSGHSRMAAFGQKRTLRQAISPLALSSYYVFFGNRCDYSSHRFKNCLRILQIGCIEALGEPTINWSKKIACFCLLALIAPQAA